MGRKFELEVNRSEIDHLLTLIHQNERDGWYEGNKANWIRNSTNLKKKLKSTATNSQKGDIANTVERDKELK